MGGEGRGTTERAERMNVRWVWRSSSSSCSVVFEFAEFVEGWGLGGERIGGGGVPIVLLGEAGGQRNC